VRDSPVEHSVELVEACQRLEPSRRVRTRYRKEPLTLAFTSVLPVDTRSVAASHDLVLPQKGREHSKIDRGCAEFPRTYKTETTPQTVLLCFGRGVGKSIPRRGRPALPPAKGLGERLRAERVRAGMTLSRLGAPVYQASYVGNVEHGRTTPSLEAQGHFAEKLGVPIADLLGGETAPLGTVKAVAGAERLLIDAQAVAPADSRRVLAAVSAMMGALRRHLAGAENRS
jgi:transcriptional regulator with XRE-family HTH domain